MEATTLLVLVGLTIALFCILSKKNLVEGMSGYGTLSGLAYNSKGLYCFKNIYDPPEFAGYASVIGKVVV